MGADGLVLHIGSHRGSGFEAALPAVVESLVEVLDSVDATPRLVPRPVGERRRSRRYGRAAPSRSWRWSSMEPVEMKGWVSVSTPSIFGPRGCRSPPSTRRTHRRDRRSDRRARTFALPAPERLEGPVRGQPGSSREHRGRYHRNGGVCCYSWVIPDFRGFRPFSRFLVMVTGRGPRIWTRPVTSTTFGVALRSDRLRTTIGNLTDHPGEGVRRRPTRPASERPETARTTGSWPVWSR